MFLSGCSLIKIYMSAGFDNKEYSLVNDVRTIAQYKDCTESHINTLYYKAGELKNYSQYIPNNDKTIVLVNNLYNMVDEFHNRKEPSQAYCHEKLSLIETTAEKIQNAIGSKLK